MLRKSLMVHPNDSVVMVLEDAFAGDTVNTPHGAVSLTEDIEFAHKVCIFDLKKAQPVIKYGEEIGYTLDNISAGSWIHIHNMGCDRGKK